MSKILVRESDYLNGTVEISGSKNASLPLMAACLLTVEGCVLKNVPKLRDTKAMGQLIESVNAEISHYKNTVKIQAECLAPSMLSYEEVAKLRGSFLLAGPLLARCGRVTIGLPGGCHIGARPVDLHLKGFAALGANICQEHGYITLEGKKLQGSAIYLDIPSVGATENIMMAAALADGESVIQNASIEPEVVETARFLKKMGAQIAGEGTDTITICGVRELHGAEYEVIPDRIEAGTFMVAAALTHGDVHVDHILVEHVSPVTAKLREMGVEIEEEDHSVHILGHHDVMATHIKTMPFPGFPTDMQAAFMSLMSVSVGTSMIVETIYENRLMQAAELTRMGAHIKIEGQTAVIDGIDKLTGAKVAATDLRSGAALVLAGLCGKGDTEVGEIGLIERGYENFIGKLQSLGARIEKKQ